MFPQGWQSELGPVYSWPPPQRCMEVSGYHSSPLDSWLLSQQWGEGSSESRLVSKRPAQLFLSGGQQPRVPSSGWDEPFSPAEGPPPTRTGLCHLANEQQPLKNPQKCLCSRGTSGVRSQRLRWFSQRVCSLVKSAPPSPPLPKPRKLRGQETDGGETNVCWLPPLFEGRF